MNFHTQKLVVSLDSKFWFAGYFVMTFTAELFAFSK